MSHLIAAGQAACRPRDNDTLPFDVLGEGLAHRPPALERTYHLRSAGRFLGRQLILRDRRLELIQQALRAVAVSIAD